MPLSSTRSQRACPSLLQLWPQNSFYSRQDEKAAEPIGTLPSLFYRVKGLLEALSDVFAPSLQSLLHQGHELIGNGAINQTVVVAKREVDNRADSNRVVAVFVGDDHGLLGDTGDTHDGGVRVVCARRAQHACASS